MRLPAAVLFLLICTQAFSQQSKSNLQIIDEQLIDILSEVKRELNIIGSDKIYVLQTGNENSSAYLKRAALRELSSFKISTEDRSDSNAFKIIISKPEIKTRYTGFSTDGILGDKMLHREINAGFDIIISEAKTGTEVFKRTFKKTAADKVPASQIELLENRSYLFGYDTLPQESFFSRYLVPIAVIAVSAAAIILFFTIRSE